MKIVEEGREKILEPVAAWPQSSTHTFYFKTSNWGLLKNYFSLKKCIKNRFFFTGRHRQKLQISIARQRQLKNVFLDIQPKAMSLLKNLQLL